MPGKPELTHDTLTARIAIFHPDYRGLMLALLLLGAVTAGLMYCSITLIILITQVIESAGAQMALPGTQEHHWLVLEFARRVGPGVAVVVAVLAAFVAVNLLASALRIGSQMLQSLMDIRSRNDIEQAMISNLLRKEDTFFLTHSIAEIANRLNVDTHGMIERRSMMIELFTMSMSVIAVLTVFAQQDWTYAAAALLFSTIGVFVMRMMFGEMEHLKNEQLESDDNIKATFEDYLGATAEIQVGNLFQKVVRRVVGVQERRQKAVMRAAVINARLGAVYSVNQLVALLAILGAIVYQMFVGGDPVVTGLVAAIVASVQDLYRNISEIATKVFMLKLSRVNVRRLTQYDTEVRPAPVAALPPPGVDAGGIEVKNVKYAYSRGEQLRGGPEGISLTLAPNSMNVIVGPAGSGKSTLAQLIMGRMQPASGRISVAGTVVTGPEAPDVSGIFSYMPQSLIVVDGSIEENIRFGIPPDHPMASTLLDDRAVGWINKTTVATLARERALDMSPVEKDLAPFSEGIAELRAKIRERVQNEARIEVMPFDPKAVVPRLTVLENLTSSAADMELLFRTARGREHEVAMMRLLDMPESKPVIEFARNVFAQTSQMLQRCPSYDHYSGLAPFPITPMLWDFRSRLHRQGVDRSDPRTLQDVLFAGLTASPPEGDGTATEMLMQFINSAAGGGFTKALADHFGSVLTPLSEDTLNANLRWRENLLFGVAKITNVKAAAEVSRIVLAEVEGRPVDAPMMRSGLRYHVGRQGKRLSGGQRQLVCLCRTFVQGNPVIIVDEPTAALDPKNRAAVNALLRDAAKDHTVIAITHDVELAKLADRVVMMKDGRLWATGGFEELVQSTPEFRQMINMREEGRL